DFTVVDGSSYTRDDELRPDEFAATDKLTAVGPRDPGLRGVRTHVLRGGTAAPPWGVERCVFDLSPCGHVDKTLK
ncbi:hypothetical protein AB0C13_05090, partial [Streptomyces sp. NPDC049099]|uniref:hypothetical protein n=1 Tax=Streptomyces sp. NPDC049099 TaxID=3155768 RepID=UPI003425704A